MRALFTKIFIALLFATCLLAPSTAQQTSSKTHILLLDTSGSMRTRYANDLKGWLVESLLRSPAFSANDRVIVREFHNQGGTQYTANDPLRKYNGGFQMANILTSVPQQVTPYDTDIAKAFDQALADIKGFACTGDVLIWLITDNVQDTGGATSIDPLYQKITGETNIHAAYIFPLLKENGTPLTATQEAMVMYLLHYASQKSSLNLNHLADEVGKRIHNEPISWYPFEDQIKLEQGNVTVNSLPAGFVDGRLVLPAAREGAPPEFAIQFRLNSQLRGREILSGKLSRPNVMIERIPEMVETEGDPNSWSAEISPSSLAIKSRQASSNTYAVTVRASNLAFHPNSFWNGLWNSTSEPIEASVQFAPNDVQTRISVASLSQVKNLASIQNVLQQGQNSKKTIRLPISFQVEYNTLWRRLLALVMAMVFICGVITGTSVIFMKTHYQLTTPAGEQLLRLPFMGRESIVINGARAATINKRFSRIHLAAAQGYAIDGAGGARPLRNDADQFLIEDQQDGRRYSYSIQRLRKAKQGAAKRDNFLDT
jgi:hypothetical protein